MKILFSPSDARKPEKGPGQVIATRGEKGGDLGCCTGSAWTPVADLVLSPALHRPLRAVSHLRRQSSSGNTGSFANIWSNIESC